MCGRFVQVWDAQLQRFVQVYIPTWKEEETILKDLQAVARGFNVAPTHRVGILSAPRNAGGYGSPRLEVARWGFRISFKAESGMPVSREIFNTRIEEAFEKPLWRGLIGKSHAVVPAQGFYEWSGPRSARVPHFITRADGAPMLMAGIVGMRQATGDRITRQDSEGEGEESDADENGNEPAEIPAREPCVSIVTCGPNDFMRPIHDRMPVILEPGQVTDWLHPLSPEKVLELCVPTAAGMAEKRVSEKVNKVENDDASLLQEQKGGQMRLF